MTPLRRESDVPASLAHPFVTTSGLGQRNFNPPKLDGFNEI
jgi:hypothetical protein